MPIQIFAINTATNAQCGEVSQLICPMPTASRKELTTPESLLSIQDQTEPETSSGSNHGTRNSARNVLPSGKFLIKNTASARPIENWKRMDTPTKSAVFSRAGAKVALANTLM